jgi:hypothetical protein
MAAGPSLQALFEFKVHPRPELVAKRDAQAMPSHFEYAEPRSMESVGDIAL